MRVLFVDDEANVLRGLARVLRTKRREWETEFAASASEALRCLGESPYDVVVTDIKMQGMDGVEFLQEVRDRHPRTIRIVLSGQADKEAILRAVGPIHQYLSKPCDPETLLSTLERASSVRALLSDEHLRGLTSQVESLPSLPSLYRDLMAQLASPDASIKEVGETISRDVSMSAKILQLVNSAFFGLRRPVSSAAHASVLLGLDAVKGLALCAHVFSQFDARKLKGRSLRGLWNHSITVGGQARLIAGHEGAGQEAASEALTSGLVHDVGKLVLATTVPAEYGRALELSRARGISEAEAERGSIGAAHTEVGAYLLGLWGLPAPIVEAVAFHHDPMACPTRGFTAVTAVHVADALAHACQSQDEEHGSWPVDEAYLAREGLSGRLGGWEQICRTSQDKEREQCKRRSCA